MVGPEVLRSGDIHGRRVLCRWTEKVLNIIYPWRTPHIPEGQRRNLGNHAVGRTRFIADTFEIGEVSRCSR